MHSLVRRFPFLADLLRAPRPAPTSLPIPARAPLPANDSGRDPALEELRSQAMRRMFPKLYSWCASRWEWGIAMEVHSYLDSATSVEELEQRIRVVERRRHFAA